MCLSLARKAKCRSLFRQELDSESLAKKCEVNFLPLVYDEVQESDDTLAGDVAGETFMTRPNADTGQPNPKSVLVHPSS